MALGTSLPARLPASSGASIFVATTGNDLTGTGLIGAPYRTLGKALSVAVNGSIIEIRGGTYTENCSLTSAKFSVSNPVTIRNYTGEKVVWQPTTADTNAITLTDSSGVRLRAQGDAETSSAGFQMTNHGLRSNGLKVTNCTSIEVDRLYFYDNYGQGLLVGGGPSTTATAGQPTRSVDVQVWNCTFTHNSTDPFHSLVQPFTGDRTAAAADIAQRHGHSIYYGGNEATVLTTGTLDGVIANCVFHHQHEGFGMRIGDAAQGLIITNNTVEDSWSPASTVSDELVALGFVADSKYWGLGISIADGTVTGANSTRDVLAYNNLVTNCQSDGIGGASYNDALMATNIVDYNYWWNNAAIADSEGLIWQQRYGGLRIYTAGAHNTPATGTAYPYNPPDHDPLYVDDAAFDYRLQAGSPCLGIANSAYCPPLDKDGNARPEPAAVGAFEASTTAVTGAAALTGTGTLTAAGVRKRLGTAALAGAGTLAVSGTRTRRGASALAGNGTLSANGVVGPEGGAGLSGIGSLSASGTVTSVTVGAAALSGVGTLSASGTVTAAASGSAALHGTGSLAASGKRKPRHKFSPARIDTCCERLYRDGGWCGC